MWFLAIDAKNVFFKQNIDILYIFLYNMYIHCAE